MSYMIKDMPIDELPREKAKKYGFESLTDADLISIILRCGTKNISVKDLSIELLKYTNGLNNLLDLRLSKLSSFKGIGEVKAITLLASLELAKRINITPYKNNIVIHNSLDVYNYFKSYYYNETQEKLMVIYLNSKNVVINKKIIFKGTANQSLVHIRDIFKEAILSNAIKFICIHNHPSGNPTPSIEDKNITERIKKVGILMDISLIDHIIFGNDTYYSFLEKDEL